jgi:hypothetical protein
VGVLHVLHLVVDDHDVVHPMFSLLNLIVPLLVRTDVDEEHKWMAGVAHVALHQFVPTNHLFLDIYFHICIITSSRLCAYTIYSTINNHTTS